MIVQHRCAGAAVRGTGPKEAPDTAAPACSGLPTEGGGPTGSTSAVVGGNSAHVEAVTWHQCAHCERCGASQARVLVVCYPGGIVLSDISQRGGIRICLIMPVSKGPLFAIRKRFVLPFRRAG